MHSLNRTVGDNAAGADLLDRFAADKLAELDARNLRRRLVGTMRQDGIWVVRDGRRLMSFSCNDYLNLTRHPRVVEAAAAALRRYGVGSGASRLVTGNHPLFAELEARLARLKGTEAACVFSSGYQANMGIIPALAGRDDLVLVDELAHACLWAGARMTEGRVLGFRHNDVDHAEELLAASSRSASPRADRDRRRLFNGRGFGAAARARRPGAPLRLLAVVRRRPRDRRRRWRSRLKLCRRRQGRRAVADGHPVEGDRRSRRRSLRLDAGHRSDRDAGPHPDLFDRAAAGDGGRGDRRARHHRERARLCCPAAGEGQAFTRRAGLKEAESPIVPVVIGEVEATLAASRLLEETGYLVAAIRPPTVPHGTARLRIAFTALHPDAAVHHLADIVRTRILTADR